MAKIDIEYLNLCARILIAGKPYHNVNRDATRLQIPSYTFRHSFEDGFPAITVKKLHWKAVVVELLWFLRGDNDIKFLNDHGIKMWNKDAYNYYLKNRPDKEHYAHPMSFEQFNEEGVGSVGRNYGVQWRDFNGKTDQLTEVINAARKDIMSSRLKVSAWNPSELDLTALPPCHTDFQIVGIPLGDGKFGFELHWTQRSTDAFLGLPFDIATYALLAKIIEKQIGYPALAIEGNLKCVHFYDNQFKAAKEMLLRDPHKYLGCELNITDFTCDLDTALRAYNILDFELVGYESYDAIKVEMLAPKQ
jgi:thymidylate synthase